MRGAQIFSTQIVSVVYRKKRIMKCIKKQSPLNAVTEVTEKDSYCTVKHGSSAATLPGIEAISLIQEAAVTDVRACGHPPPDPNCLQ